MNRFPVKRRIEIGGVGVWYWVWLILAIMAGAVVLSARWLA